MYFPLKKDEHFLAVLAAALFFWVFLYTWQLPDTDWLLPFNEPKAFFLLVLIYPVLEEIVFRGAIQGFLLKKMGGKHWHGISLANVITSLLFSLAHVLFRNPLNALLVFVPSLTFGYFRDRHHKLISPIFLHVFFNTGYFWLFGLPVS